MDLRQFVRQRGISGLFSPTNPAFSVTAGFEDYFVQQIPLYSLTAGFEDNVFQGHPEFPNKPEYIG
jgi:hypothetical protein